MSISSFALQENYNVKNALASHMLSELTRVRKENIRASMDVNNYEEHRMEEILKINGVQYINDAKAISVNATFYALESIEMPIIWLVQGTFIPTDYMPLLPLVREKVKAIICLGDQNIEVIDTFGNVVDYVIESQDMDEAVKIAYRIAEGGDAVLLSPGVSEGFTYSSYTELGNHFKQAVRNL